MSKSSSSNSLNQKKPCITILSAAAFEFEFLKKKILGSKILKETFDFKFLAIGVGPIAAAKSLIHIKTHCEDSHVILLGTCGSIGSSNHFMKLFRVDQVDWMPWDVRNKKSYLVDGFFPSYQLKKSSKYFNELEKAIVLGSSSIAKTSEKVFKKPPNIACLENLELYSLLPEMNSWGKSFTALLMVTNQTGKNAHIEWKKNYKQAAKLSGELIYKLIEKNIKKESIP